MNTLHIITRCSRTKNILKVKDSIFGNKPDDFEIFWHITFDTTILKDISFDILSELENDFITLKFAKSIPGDFGHSFINTSLDKIHNGWIYVLDDDNILHPNLLKSISEHIEEFPEKRGFIFNQKVDGKDFTGLEYRESTPENVKVQKIDMAQFLLKRELIGEKRLISGEYKADGYFIEELYNENSEDFIFIDEVLCYYNYLQTQKMPPSLPRILVMGEDISLKSQKRFQYEDDRLNCKFVDDSEVVENIASFNPDTIISIGDDFSKFKNLYNQSLDIRLRWIHSDKNVPELGEVTYKCSMNYILNGEDKNTPLVSFFTPFYNTGDKLLRTYESLKNQSWSNWEWVLVNDSSDEGKTLMIAENIAKIDCRVKVYDFREKSNGIIGESKYRAASLSRGKYIMELDHDDVLTNDATELMVKAFQKYPDAKFVYSDCAEIDEDHKSLTYGDGFAFGYGKYRTEVYNGNLYKVAVCQNINPKTIRHIVGVPNHFRAWDRKFYHSIGGHNRRLTIADDYELLIRTFLNTKMVVVRKLCYLQFFHNSSSLNNTQDSCRADIQRRVRTISEFYNESIKNRFEELGVKDWAYEFNPNNPLMCESKFGEEEGYVNYIFDPEEEKLENKIPINLYQI